VWSANRVSGAPISAASVSAASLDEGRELPAIDAHAPANVYAREDSFLREHIAAMHRDSKNGGHLGYREEPRLELPNPHRQHENTEAKTKLTPLRAKIHTKRLFFLSLRWGIKHKEGFSSAVRMEPACGFRGIAISVPNW
jgi:hypothetical protein